MTKTFHAKKIDMGDFNFLQIPAAKKLSSNAKSSISVASIP